MNTIGKNIRQLRQKQGWSQGEVAKRLNISIPAFSKIETGITDVNLSRLSQIANLFDVSVVSIIDTNGENNSNLDEIKNLKELLTSRELEIIKLQKKVIDLYEEREKEK
ncbi:transcriptional regulator [Pedobacter yulinensis]|uniref:Transcriptional regulator n=1 Tax=Pedobacter yulinensis TaxID=2126353 RepID=A0A2T3HIB8_9SPHI|nr:helix-turn-helix transcriptional regulator [Pedobacter yulinensis]PST82131.1 transcriptional regulator [Pedobacter yulinensis]